MACESCGGQVDQQQPRQSSEWARSAQGGEEEGKGASGGGEGRACLFECGDGLLEFGLFAA